MEDAEKAVGITDWDLLWSLYNAYIEFKRIPCKPYTFAEFRDFGTSLLRELESLPEVREIRQSCLTVCRDSDWNGAHMLRIKFEV